MLQGLTRATGRGAGHVIFAVFSSSGPAEQQQSGSRYAFDRFTDAAGAKEALLAAGVSQKRATRLPKDPRRPSPLVGPGGSSGGGGGGAGRVSGGQAAAQQRADALLQDFLSTKVALDETTGALRRFQASESAADAAVQRSVVQSLLGEWRFLPRYPVSRHNPLAVLVVVVVAVLLLLLVLLLGIRVGVTVRLTESKRAVAGNRSHSCGWPAVCSGAWSRWAC